MKEVRKLTLDEAREWVAEEGVSMSQDKLTERQEETCAPYCDRPCAPACEPWTPPEELVEKAARVLFAADFAGLFDEDRYKRETAQSCFYHRNARAALSVLAPVADLREVERLAAENKNLQDSIDKRGEHTDRVIQRLTQELAGAHSTVSHLTVGRDNIQANRDAVCDRLAAVTAERDRLSALLRGMARRLQQQRRAWTDLLDKAYSQNKWLVEKLERDQRELRAEVKRLSDGWAKETVDDAGIIRELEGRLANATAERDTARAELAAAQKAAQDWQDEADFLTNDRNAWRDRCMERARAGSLPDDAAEQVAALIDSYCPNGGVNVVRLRGELNELVRSWLSPAAPTAAEPIEDERNVPGTNRWCNCQAPNQYSGPYHPYGDAESCTLAAERSAAAAPTEPPADDGEWAESTAAELMQMWAARENVSDFSPPPFLARRLAETLNFLRPGQVTDPGIIRRAQELERERRPETTSAAAPTAAEEPRRAREVEE